MRAFDRPGFIAEMGALVEEAVAGFRRLHPDVEVFSVSVWTDPNARVSAVSFDTEPHSTASIEKTKTWARQMKERALAEGKLGRAGLFEVFLRAERQRNPADFEYRNFLLKSNASFPRHWEERSGEQCWNELERALLEVGEYARGALNALRLHPQAILGVNSRRDWFDRTWALSSVSGD
jgi:hypothetical protein